jgi:hypothetical protein
MKNGMLMFCAMLGAMMMQGQCPAGQVEVVIHMQTDAWPYENYWQLVPSGNPCGTGVLFEGANLNVGCNAVAADAGPDGYPAESVVTEGPFCLDPGSYDIIFTDSYGDGGLLFEVVVDGASWAAFSGTNFGNTFTFNTTTSALIPGDSPCAALPLYPDQAGLSLNNAAASASIGEIAPNGLECSTPGSWCEGVSSNSLWAELHFEANAAYRISTCDAANGVDTQLALWKTLDCSDWNAFQLVSSNDDMPGGCGVGENYASEMVVSCLDTNYRYFIQVDGWNGATGNIFLNATSENIVNDLSALVIPVWCPVNKGDTPTGYIQPYINGLGIDANYSWTSNIGFASNEWAISNLPAGEYTVEVNNACFSGSATFVVTEPTWWGIAPTIVQPNCASTADGSIALEITGGTAPYQVIWTDVNGVAIPGVPLANQSAGTYVATITDDHGCVYVQNFQLQSSGDLNVNLATINDLCINDVYTLEAPIYDGAIYQWSNGATTPNLLIDAATLGVGSHTVSVTIVTAEGCVGFGETTFYISNCVGVDERVIPSGVYPNPTSGSIQMWTGHAGQWDLLDAQGRLIRHFVFSKSSWVELDMNEICPQGFYIFKSVDNEYKVVVE